MSKPLTAEQKAKEDFDRNDGEFRKQNKLIITSGKIGKDISKAFKFGYEQGQEETLKQVDEIIEKFDFEALKKKYKPNMDLPKLIKDELKQELEKLK